MPPRGGDNKHQSERLIRTFSDPSFGLQQQQQHLKAARGGSSNIIHSLDNPEEKPASPSPQEFLEQRRSSEGGALATWEEGARGGEGRSGRGRVERGGGRNRGRGLGRKQSSWSRRPGRGLFFRSSISKTEDGEGPPPPCVPGGPAARPLETANIRSSLDGLTAAPAATAAATALPHPHSQRGTTRKRAKAYSTGVQGPYSSSGGSRDDMANGRPPTGKSWTGNFMRTNSFMRSNSIPSTGPEGRQWWDNDSSSSPVVEEEMEPEPYPPNLEKGVKVRKRSMAGKTEIRRLFVRGDTIELLNPEKRLFRSQSKIFPLSELTAVVAQGERSLSLSLGSKGLHLTLADRATKEFLWEHLRKMREQAREQAKASRITRAASIDAIGSVPDGSKSKKRGLFKRSQSYNDASRSQQDDFDDDDEQEDFLDDLTPGDGRGLRGGGLAARGRKFLMRISSRTGSSVGWQREDGEIMDGEDGNGDRNGGQDMSGGRRDRHKPDSDDWSDSEESMDEDSDEDDDVDTDNDDDDNDDEDMTEDEMDERVSPETTTNRTAKTPAKTAAKASAKTATGGVGGSSAPGAKSSRPPPPPYPQQLASGSGGTGGGTRASSSTTSSTSMISTSPETEVEQPVHRGSTNGGVEGAGDGGRMGTPTTPTTGKEHTPSSSPSAASPTIVGKGVLSTLKPVSSAPTTSSSKEALSSSRSVRTKDRSLSAVKPNMENGGDRRSSLSSLSPPLAEEGSMGDGGAGKEGVGDGETWAEGEKKVLKKVSTLPVMPRASLLMSANRPKGVSRKSVQFSVPEDEGLDSGDSDNEMPEFLSNPDVRFEVASSDRAALKAVLTLLRDALKRVTTSENGFTASRSALGLMPTAGSSALIGMRMSGLAGSSPGGASSCASGSSPAYSITGDSTMGGATGAGGDQVRLGKQFGTGLPSLLACLKGLRRTGTALSERHFFCYVGAFTELISTAEKAWMAISKRTPPDTAAIDRVKAAVIEGRQLAEDHGGGTGDIPHSGARLVVRMVRGLLERDGERLKELSRRIATAARAAIVVGDAFEDEAAAEVQLRYMACLDGAPLDKAARTHEKLRTLSELMAPFTSPHKEETLLSPLTIEDASALLWRAHDMLYARSDSNSGRRGVFKSNAAPLLPPRRESAAPPILCPELPPYHVPRLAMQERVSAGLLGRVSPWDPPMVITGAPGVGKTVLASAVARRSDIRRHFRDGIFWLPAGKDATERLPWLLEYLAVQIVLSTGAAEARAARLGALGGTRKQDDEVEVELPWGMRGLREGEVAAFIAAHLATRGLTCLLVVDDLWDRESLDQVRDLGFHVLVTANSKGLLWTQHGAGLAATLGSEVVAVDRMDDDECKLLLKRCSCIETSDWASIRDSEPVRSIMKLCRHSPHSLVMVGTTLKGQGRHFSWVATKDTLAKTVENTRAALRTEEMSHSPSQSEHTQDSDYIALYSAGKVCIQKLPDHIRNRYLHLAILPRQVPAPEQMLESLWDTESDDVFDEVLEKLRLHALLQPVTILGDQGRSGHVTSNTQMDFILNTAAGETVEHAAARMSLYLGRLKVLKSGLGRKAGGKYLAMGRCGLVSCWAEVEKRFGFTALEAYTDSIRAYREKAIASGQGSSLKLAAAVKLLADYLFLTDEKVSALEYYKEALARVNARTEHDRAKPQTQSFTSQVLKGIARCLTAEGQLEEAEQRFQKAMNMENSRNPGAARAMVEYCQILRQMGEFNRASAVCGQALALVQTGPTGPHSAESAVCVACLAGLAAQQGKPSLSEELYRRSLAVALRVFGSRHPAVAAETNVLAVFLVEHGRNQEAEGCYRQSMDIWERTLGPYSPELASGLNNLAILLFMEDRPGEAAATFQRSLDIRQRVLPPDSLETAQGLNNLALLYTSQGQDSTAAERLHREALAIRETRLGRHHPEVAQTCHNLALLLLKTGPAAAQSPASVRATGLSYDEKWKWEKVQPPPLKTGSGVAGGSNGLIKANGGGVGADALGGRSYRWRHTEAVRLLERALAVHRETLGDEHPVTEESLQALTAAGGSLSPTTPRVGEPPPRPPQQEPQQQQQQQIPQEQQQLSPSSASSSGALSINTLPSTKPVFVDPPPPSLDSLDSTGRKNVSEQGQQERAQDRQRQLLKEQDQRLQWERAQAEKLARELVLQEEQQLEQQRQKEQREKLKQQHLEQQALAREEAERKAKEDKQMEDKQLALLAQRQQRQLQQEQRERQQQVALAGIRGRSSASAAAARSNAPELAGTDTAVVVRGVSRGSSSTRVIRVSPGAERLRPRLSRSEGGNRSSGSISPGGDGVTPTTAAESNGAPCVMS